MFLNWLLRTFMPFCGPNSSACLPDLLSFFISAAGSAFPDTVTFPCSRSMLVLYTPVIIFTKY
ncbi:hypothetical protein Hanom_Chr14g01284031 [Helianthus anomalus]